MMKRVLSLFDRFIKGDEGEEQVLEGILSLLKSTSSKDNYFIIPKVQIEDVTTTKEIDLVLLHPVYGIFIIEVKNWNSFDNYLEKSSPFEQAKRYRNLFLAKIEDRFRKIPINVEYRVFFPSLTYEDARRFFAKHPELKVYKTHSFFKEDLTSKDNFQRFFKTSVLVVPKRKEFLEIAKLLIDKKQLQKQEERILPIISQNEIIFFDHKQLSVLNGYTGGFRIIRGVAGTGKTIILTNFIQNRLKRYPDERFLVLCFNNKLANKIKESLDRKYQNGILVESIFKFLERIGFDQNRYGKSLDELFENFESDEALKEFRQKLQKYLKLHPFDYFLCDETQDMPEGFMRILYEEIEDCIFFIDEAQKFYQYSMDSISEVFHHKKFEKISMKGRVKNLKNVYRTPSNIARCAFEILSKDTKLNAYYRKSYYLQKSFLTDINFILEDGSIIIGNYNDFSNLRELVESLDDDTIILAYTKKQKEAIENLGLGKEILTIQSVKGLEAKNIVIVNFDLFLNKSFEKEYSIFYRKLYVLLTRAQRNIYLSIDPVKLSEEQAVQEVYKILQKYSSEPLIEEKIEPAKLLKTSFDKEKIKEAGELVVLGAEIFSIIAGFFE